MRPEQLLCGWHSLGTGHVLIQGCNWSSHDDARTPEPVGAAADTPGPLWLRRCRAKFCTQLCNRLLRNWAFAPCSRERGHVLDVSSGQALYVREFPSKVIGQPLDDGTPPALNFLRIADVLPNSPVQLDQLGVDRAQRQSYAKTAHGSLAL